MKVCIEFNLSEAGELHELSDALNGGTWRGVVVDLDNILRDKLKHGDPMLTAQGAMALGAIRDELLAAVTNCGLDLHEPTFNYSPTSGPDIQADDRRRIYVDTKSPDMDAAMAALTDQENREFPAGHVNHPIDKPFTGESVAGDGSHI
jgi:hypothetical protein